MKAYSLGCYLMTISAGLSLLLSTLAAADGLQYPLSIAVSGDAMFLADRDFHGIWKVEGEKLSPFFQGQKQFRTPLNAVRCVELDRDGKLLAGDSATREVYRFDEAGQPVPLTSGGIGIPMDIAVNQAGDLFVSDLETQRIVKIPAAGGEPQEIAQIPGCRGLFVDHEDHLWVVSTTKDQLHRLAPDGKLEVILKDRPFQFPHTVVVDDELTAYVCDGYAKTIWKIPKGGVPQAWVQGAPLINPVGMTRRGDQLLVVDPHAKAVFEIDSAGKVTQLNLQPAS